MRNLEDPKRQFHSFPRYQGKYADIVKREIVKKKKQQQLLTNKTVTKYFWVAWKQTSGHMSNVFSSTAISSEIQMLSPLHQIYSG